MAKKKAAVQKLTLQSDVQQLPEKILDRYDGGEKRKADYRDRLRGSLSQCSDLPKALKLILEQSAMLLERDAFSDEEIQQVFTCLYRLRGLMLRMKWQQITSDCRNRQKLVR